MWGFISRISNFFCWILCWYHAILTIVVYGKVSDQAVWISQLCESQLSISLGNYRRQLQRKKGWVYHLMVSLSWPFWDGDQVKHDSGNRWVEHSDIIWQTGGTRVWLYPVKTCPQWPNFSNQAVSMIISTNSKTAPMAESKVQRGQPLKNLWNLDYIKTVSKTILAIQSLLILHVNLGLSFCVFM